ncbi:fimbrial protein [Pseudomonas nitroreducens]|uniref:fimbrial protein n=1 Tax=Pseudomonas TaxID=286 RepID=UPI0003829ED2|nr:fimbrial protein [Pseudomonas nitroreducens]
MKPIHILATCILSFCLSIAALPAFARYSDCTAPLPMTLSTPNVGVLSSLPVGQTIPGTRTSFSLQVSCNFTFAPTDGWYLFANGQAFSTTPYANVYTYPGLAASGLGLRVLGASGTALTLESSSVGFRLKTATGNDALSGAFELVKLSNTISTVAQSTQWWFHVPNQQWANQTDVKSTLTYNYTVSRPSIPTCSVDTPSLEVTLPNVGKQTFRAMGATAGAQAFNLGLHCEANVRAQLSFSDMSNPGNAGNSLRLATASTAAGLGVQLLSQGSVVQYTPAGGSTGTVLSILTNSTAQAVVIPLIARYVQVNDSVAPGTVIANAAYTLTYL